MHTSHVWIEMGLLTA
ncbi:hypothetical protein DSL72_001757 [Monilinia vaccinii-corymbosi]|uniref:Uncharacterized protein n=1 Tax=Monilinia vaccinii-corymbosi TaxID=61207 RepID=A0A8A3PAR0_9HELO|nr:hypothetical protein DSL72_001757 [Monilinia vaccinii-corymbosi]